MDKNWTHESLKGYTVQALKSMVTKLGLKPGTMLKEQLIDVLLDQQDSLTFEVASTLALPNQDAAGDFNLPDPPGSKGNETVDEVIEDDDIKAAREELLQQRYMLLKTRYG